MLSWQRYLNMNALFILLTGALSLSLLAGSVMAAVSP